MIILTSFEHTLLNHYVYKCILTLKVYNGSIVLTCALMIWTTASITIVISTGLVKISNLVWIAMCFEYSISLVPFRVGISCRMCACGALSSLSFKTHVYASNKIYS